MEETIFTENDFNDKYINDDVCLHEIFRYQYGKETVCPYCGEPFRYYKINGRKCYACQFCAKQIYPLAGTIFHKSDTPLRQWFYAIFLYSAYSRAISAKELQRQLGVTYKCAWRMMRKIQLLLEKASSQKKR
jgi:hypothetical protein